MSVIITGIDMPKSCSECPMCHPKGKDDPWNYCCFVTMDDINIEEWDTERYITCPLQSERTWHCKDCKYFEYDSVAKVDGIPLIVAHEICLRWGDGCKTSEDGYCFMYEPQERGDKE